MRFRIGGSLEPYVGLLLKNHLFQNSYSRESSVLKQSFQGIICGKTVIPKQLGVSPSITHMGYIMFRVILKDAFMETRYETKAP
jgi:hypothetical protein